MRLVDADGFEYDEDLFGSAELVRVILETE